MARRLKLARTGAAVVGASVALLMTAAIPAGADPVTGKVDPDGYKYGHHVDVGEKHDSSTSLIGFELEDGTKLQMYCVEIKTRINREHGMIEKPWDSYPNAESPFHKNRANINWILHNGFPVVGTDALAKTLTAQGAKLKDGLSEKEAISATQAAVWHYSDGTKLNEANPLPKGPEDAKADVITLYKYLTGAANVGLGDQPTPALAISPGDLAGKAGEKIGPFTVTTTGKIDKLVSKLPEGVKLVDAKGVELTAETVKDGSQIFLDVPKDAKEGAGTFELNATAGVDTGRLFVGENYAEKPTQSLIVAKAEKSEIAATASAKWAEATPATSTSSTPPTTSGTTSPVDTPTTTSPPAPQAKNTSGDLAETGVSIFVPIMIGVVLVGAGIGSLLFLRHRKRV